MANLVGLKDFETKASKDYKRAMLEVSRHMNEVLADDTLLAWIIAGGKTRYLNVFLREFRCVKGVDREMADLLWALYHQTWSQRYPHQHPGRYLDGLHIASPPSPREIEAAWVHESASSDDARRHFGVA